MEGACICIKSTGDPLKLQKTQIDTGYVVWCLRALHHCFCSGASSSNISSNFLALAGGMLPPLLKLLFSWSQLFSRQCLHMTTSQATQRRTCEASKRSVARGTDAAAAVQPCGKLDRKDDQ